MALFDVLNPTGVMGVMFIALLIIAGIFILIIGFIVLVILLVVSRRKIKKLEAIQKEQKNNFPQEEIKQDYKE